jgi:GT2 family glycosyltransferase
MSIPDLSIVTLTWNSQRFVEPWFRSLDAESHASGMGIELFAVDNGSTDETVANLKSFPAKHVDFKIIQLGRNLGTTLPRNIALRMARAPLLVILDSDTEIPPGSLRSLVKSMDEISGPVGLVAPRLVYPDGKFQESARRFPTLFTKAYRILGMEEKRVADESIPGVLAGEITKVDYAISAAWLVPRTTFERIGYLDEDIFYSPEDVEFCARAWQHGMPVWYYPKAEIVHNCQRITHKRPLSKLGLSHAKHLVRYWAKYGTALQRPKLG